MLREFIRKHGKLKIRLLVFDWIAISLAAISTFFLHYFTGLDDYDLAHSLTEYILRIAILYVSFPLLVLIMRHHLLYKQKVYSTVVPQLAQLARAILINSLLLIALLFFLREEWIQHSRTNLLLFTATCFFWTALFRTVIFRKRVLPRLSVGEIRRVLLVGTGVEAEELIRESEAEVNSTFRIVAVVDFGTGMSVDGVGRVILHRMPLLQEFVRIHDIHEIVIAENELDYEEVLRIVGEAREAGVSVQLLSDHFKVVQERVTRSASEFATVAAAPVSHGYHGFYALYLKRAVDIVGAGVGIVLLFPFWLVVAIAIKMSSKGRVLYKTTVVGQDGSSFAWYKFRTMRTGEPTRIHEAHVSEFIQNGTVPAGKLEHDPRITAIGGWLRRHSLDEFPQLLNVLRGEMSLIGPRPCLPYEFEQYLDWHKSRFVVRPGMTGLWQVSGRSAVSFNDMVILDLYYIHNISLWLDMAIILRTIGVVFTGRGGG